MVCLSACWDITPPPPDQAPPGADTPLGPGTPRADTPDRADTPWDQAPLPGADTPPEQTPPGAVHAGRYGQQAGGMHPTGMQSCY